MKQLKLKYKHIYIFRILLFLFVLNVCILISTQNGDGFFAKTTIALMAILLFSMVFLLSYLLHDLFKSVIAAIKKNWNKDFNPKDLL